MTSSRTVIAATVLATTMGLSACSGSSSSHNTSAAKKSSASSSTAASPSTSTTPPTVTSLIQKMQTNLKNAKTLHLHTTGRDLNGELLHNGPQDISMDIVGSTADELNDTTIKSGEATMQARNIAGTHYIKANSALWKSTLTKTSSRDAAQRARRYTDKWVKTPTGMTSFDALSIQSLIKPLLQSELTSQITEANTTVSAVDFHGIPAWKLVDKTGKPQLWISQKTGDLLELKYGANPTSELPLNDFTFSDVNKDFHITAPADAITP